MSALLFLLMVETETPVEQKTRKPRKAKPRPDQVSEMQKLANLPTTVEAFGRNYLIKKFSLGQIAQSVAYLGPLQFVVRQLADEYEKEGELSKGQIAGIVLGALSQSGYAMIGLICVATSEPSEWIEEQDDPIGAMEILTVVVEQNADFFSRKNLDRVKGLVARLQQAIPALSGITSTP